ncbi:unnamed protein product [Acanthoscelides obtectus]|uniref:Uncharacterized protein n=1 Tax=Acanthoscelides obtectus TaxID=200917 RepID=A0A9P0JJ83_ACAOB|nr:unnamed protein product [Acanthoscelides obtectus]CAK1624914.1 hypothetical protein AOBTE_LOCUS2849 [Acanthoscelides obtectus]
MQCAEVEYEDFAVDIPGDGEQEEIHNGVIRQREGSLLGPAFIVVAFSTGPALPDASSMNGLQNRLTSCK